MSPSYARTPMRDAEGRVVTRVVGSLLFLTLLLLAAPAWAGPFLAWDAVTTDPDGLPLGAGQEVTTYRVYKCGPSASGPCAAPDRVLVGTVAAPATQFDLAAQAVPQAFVVTAVNRVGESSDSIKLKVTPSGAPKNPRLLP